MAARAYGSGFAYNIVMATLSITQHFTVTIDGQTHTGGSTGTPTTITVSEEHVYDRTISIPSDAAAATEILRTAEDDDDANIGVNDDIENWDFLFLECDQNCEVRLLVSEGGTAAGSDLQVGFVIHLLAGQPQMFTGGDLSRNLDTTNVISTAAGETNLDTTWDTWETAMTTTATTGDVARIMQIEASQASGSVAKLRIFAVT